MHGTRIVVAHPHRVIADALAESLRAADVEVVGSTTSVRELVELARGGRPDVAVVDLEHILHGQRSPIGALKGLAPDLAVLVVAAEADRFSVEQTLAGGADGFILTTTTLPAFRDAVRRVAAGEVVLHPDVAAMLVQSTTTSAGAAGSPHRPSPPDRGRSSSSSPAAFRTSGSLNASASA